MNYKLSDFIMQNYVLISIITPTWACADFIAETIRSVQFLTLWQRSYHTYGCQSSYIELHTELKDN